MHESNKHFYAGGNLGPCAFYAFFEAYLSRNLTLRFSEIEAAFYRETVERKPYNGCGMR